MKLIHVVCMIIVMSIFASSFYSGISNVRKLSKEINEMQMQVDSLLFISESFRNMCEGKGFSSFVEWQKCCKQMWQLEYIAWSEADDFMKDDVIDDFTQNSDEYGNYHQGTLMYGKWIGRYGEGEVFCRIK